MREKTLEYIKKMNMVEKGEGIVLGFSGGGDSVCLLSLLKALEEELGISLRAVHVNHGLRKEEAVRDEIFAGDFCRARNIPFLLHRVDAAAEARRLGVSVEEAGRLLRYQILEEEAERWEEESGKRVRIAMAHHGNDSAETILHNLFRGSGLRGLGGIPPVRGRIIRPILWAPKSCIREYLKQEGLSWVEDSSNGDSEYTRNRIRNELLPLAEEAVHGQAAANILRAGEWIRQADSYLDRLAGRWLEEHADGESRGQDCGSLDCESLAAEEEILQGYIIRRVMEQRGYSLKDITAGHIAAIRRLAEKETGKRVSLPGGIGAEREYGRLRFFREEERASQAFCLPLVPGERLALPDGRSLKTALFPCKNPADFPRNQYTKWFDYDRIKDTLVVRNRQAGDYFSLPGGGRKTVKSYLIDEKIPRRERDRMALLAEGSHVLWLFGHRISDHYKITEETKRIFQVQLDGGADNGR